MPVPDREKHVFPSAHAREAHGGALTDLMGPLSPELVLVSPELAKLAKALLPDRPWEQFAPPRARLDALQPPAPSLPVVPRSSLVLVSAPSSAPDCEPALRPTTSRSVLRRPSVGLVAWAVFGTLVLVSTLPIVRDAPSLGEASPTAGRGGSAVSAGTGATPEAPIPRTASESATMTGPRGEEGKPADVSPATGTGSNSAPGQPEAYSGAYLSDGVRLVFDASKSLVLSLTVSGLCGTKTTIGEIPVSKAGRFSAARRVGASTVIVRGRFQPPGLVSGAITVRRPSCESRSRSFTARIS